MGDLVYHKVNSTQQKSFSSCPISKLNPKYYGPFPIIAKVGPIAYRLQLPDHITIHPIFRVSLLKKTIGSWDIANVELPPMLDDYLVKVEPLAIFDKRVIYKDAIPLTQVLVRWSHLHLDHTTWEYLPDLLT